MSLFDSTAFEMNVAVAILRVQEGLDYTGILADLDELIPGTPKKKSKDPKSRKQDELPDPGIYYLASSCNLNSYCNCFLFSSSDHYD